PVRWPVRCLIRIGIPLICWCCRLGSRPSALWVWRAWLRRARPARTREPLARGIPAVVTAGTGAIEALQEGATKHSAATPGTSVSAGDSAGLAAVLSRAVTETLLRPAW